MAANGNLSDGSGTANYENNAICEWLIAPPNAAQITLTFTQFVTQSILDVLTVYQCTDIGCQTPQQLAELSGTYPTSQKLTSNTGFLKIVFISDGSITYDGFGASWSSVR
jgi:hypothetical protein